MKAEVKSLPKPFLEKLSKLIAPHHFDRVVNTFAQKRLTTFRTNFLKTNTKDLKESLQQQGFLIEEVPYVSDAFTLRKRNLRELQGTENYQSGEFYVQNVSSMIPVFVLDPQPGETILDLTAAPGSKTTQIASMTQGQATLHANDNNKVRFFKLKANLEMQGAEDVEISLRYGESFGRSAPEAYDRVLLDAPCSAEGRFLASEPKTYRYWKPAKVKEMMKKQKKLFASALHALRVEGTLVYSTCTFSPEENEGVLDWVFRKFGDAIELETIDLGFPNQRKGLVSWQGKDYHPSISKSVRILPTDIMEGFFVAKLRKLKSIKTQDKSD